MGPFPSFLGGPIMQGVLDTERTLKFSIYRKTENLEKRINGITFVIYTIKIFNNF